MQGAKGWACPLEGCAVLTVLAWFVGFCLAVQLAGVALALSTLYRPAPADARRDTPGITILRPVCGLENQLHQTLASTFTANYPLYEIIFCVASPTDAAIPLVHDLIAANPHIPAKLLIGDEKVSGNPKLNNLVKGWNAAAHPLILMSDSNVILPPDTLQRLLDQWTPGTGLVSSPPIGTAPAGFWASLECAFLNTFQARWQMAASRLGNGFAQGKMLFWERKLVESNGGLAQLGKEMAEDVASTKLVRSQGLHVRLPGKFFEQPIGPRQFQTIWSRQVRWARVRRLGFPALFLPELITGALFPTLALLILILTGKFSLLTLPLLLVVWYSAEYLLAAAGDWPRQPADIAAWALRDALLPALWVACWAGSGFEWRGTAMTVDQTTANDPKDGA